MTATIHPIRPELAGHDAEDDFSADDFAGLLAVEFELMVPWTGDDAEARSRAKWDAIATGEITRNHQWECGVGVAATATIVEGWLRESFEGRADELAVVLGWLAAWLADRRAGVRS